MVYAKVSGMDSQNGGQKKEDNYVNIVLFEEQKNSQGCLKTKKGI